MGKNKYKAAIIGAGNIGAFYSPPDNNNGILTHAHVYRHDNRVKLSAFVENDKQKAKKAARLWGVPSYYDVREMFEKESPDIVSICVPDCFHEMMLGICLEYRPKLVLCEKPLTTDVTAAARLVRLYKQAGVLLAVNYTRRWSPYLLALKKDIKNNKYGKVLNAVGVYSKGTLHNGSHLVDMLRYFFGEVSKGVVLGGRIDWKESDPTLDAFLTFQEGAVAHLVAGDERQYSIFDLDILFENGRICLTEFGNRVAYYKASGSAYAKGDKDLRLVCQKGTALIKTPFMVMKNLINAVEGKESLICSGEDAVATQKVCCDLLKQCHVKRGMIKWRN